MTTMTSNLGYHQQQVVDEAKKRLSTNSWYSGVCLDQLPSEEECANDFEGAVTMLEMDTAYHDADDFFSPND